MHTLKRRIPHITVLFLLILCSYISKAQKYTQNPGYFQWTGGLFDQGFRPPIRDTVAISGKIDSIGFMVLKPQDSTFYRKGKPWWYPVGKMTDTTGLSKRIDSLRSVTPSSDTVPSIAALRAYVGKAYTLVVTDTIRGGIFYRSSLGAIDNGIVFGGVGGKWVRSGASEVWRLTWWNVKNDGVTDCSDTVRYVMNKIISKGGGTLLIPSGTYIMSRNPVSPFDMFLLGSNTRVIGEGIERTILKLNPSDLLNFRRMFTVLNTSDVVNIEVANLSIDMSNTFTTYPPGGAFTDAQNAGIFIFSTSNIIRNVSLHDLFIHDVTGDVIGISKSGENVTIDRIYQRDYLRQGISIGGSGAKNVYINHIYDMPFINGVIKGGNSIHTEPAATVFNINYKDCAITDFSMSLVDGGVIDNLVANGTSPSVANNVKNFNIKNCVIPNASFQVSALGDNIVVTNNSFQKLIATTVSGGSRSVNNFTINANNIHNTLDYGLHVNNVVGATITNNNITVDSAIGVYLPNSDFANISGNTVKVLRGSFQGIYTVTTTTASFGIGKSFINNNIISSPYRGLQVGNQSVVVGSNTITAPTPINYTGVAVKNFPVNDGTGKQLLTASALPAFGVWRLGDEITLTNSTNGSVYKYICSTAGASSLGVWSSGSTYYINDYVTGSNGSIYVAGAVNGQLQDPTTDVSATYWTLASATTAIFKPFGIIGTEYYGSGTPESSITAPVGATYRRSNAPSADSTMYVKGTGTGNTGWKPLVATAATTPTMQTVTTAGPQTTNFIVATGLTNPQNISGLHIGKNYLYSGNWQLGTYDFLNIQGTNIAVTGTGTATFEGTNTVTIRANGAGQVVNVRAPGGVSIGSSSGTTTTFLDRISGSKAIFSTEYVRKDQLDSAAAKQNIVPLKDVYTDQGNSSATPNNYTALHTFNVAANTLTANGQKILMTSGGNYSATVGTKDLQLFVGGNGCGTFLSTSVSDGWHMDVFFIRTGTTTGRVIARVTGGTALSDAIETDLTGLDYTNAITFAVWGASGTGTVNDVTAKLTRWVFEQAAP